MVQARKKVDVLATAPSNHIFDRPTLAVGLAIVGLSIIPQVLSLDHLGHEPDQGGAGHSQ